MNAQRWIGCGFAAASFVLFLCNCPAEGGAFLFLGMLILGGDFA